MTGIRTSRKVGPVVTRVSVPTRMQGTKALARARGDILASIVHTKGVSTSLPDCRGRGRGRADPDRNRPRPRQSGGVGDWGRMLFLAAAVPVWLLVLGIFLWLRGQEP